MAGGPFLARELVISRVPHFSRSLREVGLFRCEGTAASFVSQLVFHHLRMVYRGLAHPFPQTDRGCPILAFARAGAGEPATSGEPEVENPPVQTANNQKRSNDSRSLPTLAKCARVGQPQLSSN